MSDTGLISTGSKITNCSYTGRKLKYQTLIELTLHNTLARTFSHASGGVAMETVVLMPRT